MTQLILFVLVFSIGWSAGVAWVRIRDANSIEWLDKQNYLPGTRCKEEGCYGVITEHAMCSEFYQHRDEITARKQLQADLAKLDVVYDWQQH